MHIMLEGKWVEIARPLFALVRAATWPALIKVSVGRYVPALPGLAALPHRMNGRMLA